MAHAQVTPVSQADAVRALAAARGLVDPSTGQRPTAALLEAVAAAGVSMVLETEAGALLLVLDRRGDELWIEGATGAGRGDLTRAGLTFAEETAKHLGCRAVCFWTARRGLMRKARRLGYVGTDREFTKALP